MADGVTLASGNNTSPSNGTKFDTKDGGAVGHIPAVVVGYSDGSGGKVTSDASGLLIQGTATLSGVTSATASRSTVNDTTSSTTLISSNADRIGWRIRNTSSADLYVAFGGTASATNCIAALDTAEFAGQSGIGTYTGDIVGAWATDPGDGVAVITEW